MATNEEVLVNFQGVDNVSPVAQQIEGSVGAMSGGIRGAVSRLGSAFSGLNGLVMGFFGMYGLSSFKNMTYGMATAREEVKGLYDATIGATAGTEGLWDKMDTLTNNGYVQLDDLTQAMNVFKMSTNANGQELDRASEVINMIGNRAIQMGKDSNSTMLLMMGVSKGLNGNFQMLNNTFGVTKEALIQMGWSGNKDDAIGYLNALDKYVNSSGDLGDLLDSTQGRVVSLQKRFRIAGREMGNAMLPTINAIMDKFSQLNAESDDMLAKVIILSTGAMSGFASILPTITPLITLYEVFGDTIRIMNTRVIGLGANLVGLGERAGMTALQKSVGLVANGFGYLAGRFGDLNVAMDLLNASAMLRNLLEESYVGIMAEENAWATARLMGMINETAYNFLNADGKTIEAMATMGLNEQLALQNYLTMVQMGLTDEQIMAKLVKIGLIKEETLAVGELTFAEKVLAVVQSALFWEVTLIIGVIIALFLIIDQMGKALGWWSNWGEMLESIWAGLNRLWQAFINNPNVQGFIKDIQWIFGELGKTIQWVAWQVLQFFGWKDDGGEVDIVRGIIDVFGALGDMLGKVVNAVKWFAKTFGPYILIVLNSATLPIQMIVGLLRSIICALIGCSPGIVPALQSMANVFRSIWNGLASFITNPIGTILRAIQGLTGNFFNIARNMGLSLWNGLNSVLGGMPQRVWQTFFNMLNNLKRIPQMIWGTAQDIGQQAYNGLDSAVSGLTGGLIHLPNANAPSNARQNARTMGNATKNYNNSHNVNRGHTINIGHGAIQLDARNLTTKESKQIMINALEGLTTYETVHTKKASGR